MSVSRFGSLPLLRLPSRIRAYQHGARDLRARVPLPGPMMKAAGECADFSSSRSPHRASSLRGRRQERRVGAFDTFLTEFSTRILRV